MLNPVPKVSVTCSSRDAAVVVYAKDTDFSGKRTWGFPKDSSCPKPREGGSKKTPTLIVGQFVLAKKINKPKTLKPRKKTLAQSG